MDLKDIVLELPNKPSELDQLKNQLAVYKEDMAKDAEKIAYEQMQASCWKSEYLKMARENQEIKAKIKSQIELLEEASKSRIAYNERERNILKSQADDLAKMLRGES